MSTAILSLLAGACAGNAVPHFIKGATKERFPTVFGTSPVINVVAGWTGFVLAALLVHWAAVQRHPLSSAVAGALGVLVAGLFHASIGAIGPRVSRSGQSHRRSRAPEE